MGGGKGGSKASTPDYTALAKQQGQINQDTAQQLTQANRPNQYDAFGNSITWSQGNGSGYDAANQALNDYWNQLEAKYPGGAGEGGDREKDPQMIALRKALSEQTGTQWNQNQNLNPETKAAWDKYNSDTNAATSKYGDILNNYLKNYNSTPFSSSAQNVKAYNDPEFNGKDVADATYNSVMDRALPQQQRDSAALDTQLRQQGLTPGTEAYNNSMQNLMKSQGDVTTLASQNATIAGNQDARAKYASYLSGNQSQYGQDQNTYQMNQNMPLQQLSGMAGIAGGTPYTPTYTGFSSATGYNPTDLVGAAQATTAANQSSRNSSNSKKGSTLGAASSLGGSYLGSK